MEEELDALGEPLPEQDYTAMAFTPEYGLKPNSVRKVNEASARTIFDTHEASREIILKLRKQTLLPFDQRRLAIAYIYGPGFNSVFPEAAVLF